jgi:hypothetical protein
MQISVSFTNVKLLNRWIRLGTVIGMKVMRALSYLAPIAVVVLLLAIA